jgi:hypothetical protein
MHLMHFETSQNHPSYSSFPSKPLWFCHISRRAADALRIAGDLFENHASPDGQRREPQNPEIQQPIVIGQFSARSGNRINITRSILPSF